MRMILYVIVFFSFISAQAEVCGTTSSSLSNASELILYVGAENSSAILVRANSESAKKFASRVKFLGASICDINASYKAPFNVCFTGNEKSNLAVEFYCGDNDVCSGIGCGTN